MRWGRARGGAERARAAAATRRRAVQRAHGFGAHVIGLRRIDAAHAAAVMSYEIEAWVAHYHPMLRVQAWGGPLSPHAASLHWVMLACFPPSADRALCVRIRTIPLDMEERASRRPK